MANHSIAASLAIAHRYIIWSWCGVSGDESATLLLALVT